MRDLPARPFVRLAVFFCLGLALLGAVRTAPAQCAVSSAPSVFDPSPGAWAAAQANPQLGPFPTSIAVSDGPFGRRLVTRWNLGFAVYGAADPARPTFAFLEDMFAEGYPKNGDGSDRTGELASSADGTRVVTPWTDVAGYGTVVELGGPASYTTTGGYEGYVPYGTQNQTAVLTYGSRYLGFTLTPGNLLVADITDIHARFAPGSPGSIPSEPVRFSVPLRFDSIAIAQGAGKSYLVINAQSTILVVDVTTPGPAGPNLTKSFVATSFSTSSFFPTGTTPPSRFYSVAAAIQPVDQSLYIAVEGGSTTSAGMALAQFDEVTHNVHQRGFFKPAAPMNGLTPAAVMVPWGTDLVSFFVSKSSTGKKLRAFAASDFTQDLATSGLLPLGMPTGVLTAIKGAGTKVYLYGGDANEAWAGTVDCTLPGAATPLRFVPIAPCRVADTRAGTGLPLAAGEVRVFDVQGSGCGVPPAAQALSLNVTVTQPVAAGSLAVFPAGAETPGTQVVAFSAGQTRAASVLIQVGTGGAVAVSNGSTGTAHVILDVNGAFQ